MRDIGAQPKHILQQIISQIGRLFNWESAEMEYSVTPEGMHSFKPKVVFGKPEGVKVKTVPVETALRVLDVSLKEVGYTLWVAIDRLDEAFQGYPEVEVPALRGLFRSYLDMSEFESIRLKLFVRRDLFRRITVKGFVNLTHVNAKKFEIIWDEEDLLNLLCRRIRKNAEFCRKLNAAEMSDNALFDLIFPEKVEHGLRKPKTWTWIMRRIRDGNDIKPPRNLIDLISMSKIAQLRIEDRVEDWENRQLGDEPLIQAQALKSALNQLSKQRVTDTLLAEVRSLAPTIEKFRGGKAEHNLMSLALLLGLGQEETGNSMRQLMEIGFLEEIKGTYKVPALYRDGLEITQGKAFEDGGSLERASEDGNSLEGEE